VNIFSRIYHKLFFLHQWYLLFDLSGDPSSAFSQFKELIPSKDRFWADPFVVLRDQRYFVFIEEYIYRRGKGHLAVMEMDAQGGWKEPVRVLEKPYHLSYPFVFEWEGVYYLVPESVENQTIDLYECVEFPTKWQFKKTLMEGVLAVDSTLLRYQEKWWLFTGIAAQEKALPFVELHIFYSDDLLANDWRSHPKNPVVSQVDCARPAGSLFIREGKIIRPAQNCSKMYGYGVDFYEIMAMSETEYLEKKVESIQPDWDAKALATHSYSRNGSLTVIDALQKRWKWA
jgi:hypothetical protein